MSQQAIAQNIETIWRARGLEAQDKVKELNQEKVLSKKQTCEMIIEKAFAWFADKEAAKRLVYKDGKTVSFSFIAEEQIILGFIYHEEKAKIPYMVTPVFTEGAKKTKWSFTLMNGREPGSFILAKGGCAYGFFASDYLHPKLED